MNRCVWHESSGFLFHYTEYAEAQAIEDSLIGRPGPGAHYGFGFYATDIAPQDDVAAIHSEIFPDGRARLWDAVVVLEVGEGHPFVRVAPHQYVAHGEGFDTDDVPLADFVVGIGRFLDVRGEWDLDEDLIAR